MIRSLIARGIAALALTSLAFCSPAMADITVKDGAGASQTLHTFTFNGVQTYAFAPIDTTGAGIDPATKQLQTTGNASLATITGTIGVTGTPQATAQTVMAAALPLPAGAASAVNQAPLATPGALGTSGTTVTSVLPQLTPTAGLAISFGTTAAPLFNANASRHFIQVQVQGTPDTTGANGCYINGISSATADANSLFIPRGGYFESTTHVGTAAIAIVCTGTMAVYSRQG